MRIQPFCIPSVNILYSPMPLPEKLQKVFLNSWFIAIILGSVVFFMIPFKPDPYVAELIFNARSPEENAHIQFYDLDGDGLDEMIKSFYNEESQRLSHLVLLSNGNIKDQYNIDGELNYLLTKCFIGDYNQDGKAELFSLIVEGRNVYLNIIIPFCEDCQSHNAKIKVYEIPDEYLLNFELERNDMKLVDWSGNGNLELVCSLFGRYKFIDPRGLYAIDIDNKTVRRSPSYGNSPSSLVLFDHDQDGRLEISGKIGSGKNIHDEAMWEYPDHTAWLMVFNDKLELINDVKGFPGPFTTLCVYPVERDGKTELAGLMAHSGPEDYESYLFETKNLNEIIIRDKIGERVQNPGTRMNILKSKEESKIVIPSHEGDLVFYDLDLNFLSKETFNKQKSGIIYILDLDDDGTDEIIMRDFVSHEWVIVDSAGKLMTTIPTGYGESQIESIGVTNGNRGFVGYYHHGDIITYFTIHKNYFHYLKWLLLLGLVGAFYALAYVFKWIQRKQSGEKEILRHQINTLQLQSIKNQLDPHFTFNALNVLNYLSINNDNEGVESFTHHFSKLIRSQLEMSDQPAVKLYDELGFVHHYIELQKLRFDVPIIYDEEVSGEVDMNLRIPKMMIHTHVENAIKHGLLPTERGGYVKVIIIADKNCSKITIWDNGVGRSIVNNGSKEVLKNNTGKGLAILNQQYDLFDQLFKRRIRQEIEDLIDENKNPAGTKIVIRVPE
ncbi:MAG: histidine kinase [Bacteroidetes bacterium]|nr:histidine kinase [Bacteroidota bacterium]